MLHGGRNGRGLRQVDPDQIISDEQRYARTAFRRLSSASQNRHDRQIVAGFADAMAIRELVAGSDVSTFEFEHIDADTLVSLELEGYAIYPSGSTLKKIQDKYVQKKMLREMGIPVPEFYSVSNYAGLLRGLKQEDRY